MKIIISAATLYKFLNGKCYHPLLVSADVELALECLLTQWADLLAQPASQYWQNCNSSKIFLLFYFKLDQQKSDDSFTYFAPRRKFKIHCGRCLVIPALDVALPTSWIDLIIPTSRSDILPHQFGGTKLQIIVKHVL